MISELVLFVSIVAIITSTVTLWLLNNAQRHLREMIEKLWSRLHYTEMALNYHDLIPMPWELEDLEKIDNEKNSFKREGNIVYLQQEEKGPDEAR